MREVTEEWIEHHDPLLNDKEAARLVGSTPNSLRQSRYTGLLFGVPAPRFIKLGRSIRYRLSEILAFRELFPEVDSTTKLDTD
jgi:predicted DNA-binding transcriptional regulator AlpA